VKKTELNSSEICAIIEACGKAGVQTLKYGALDVTFQGVFTPAAEPAPGTIPAVPELAARFEAAAIAQDESAIKAAQEMMALVEDPELYERLQLEDAKDAQDDH
jgi:hypothetical protein